MSRFLLSSNTFTKRDFFRVFEHQEHKTIFVYLCVPCNIVFFEVKTCRVRICNFAKKVVCFRPVWDTNLNLNSTSEKILYHETFLVNFNFFKKNYMNNKTHSLLEYPHLKICKYKKELCVFLFIYFPCTPIFKNL